MWRLLPRNVRLRKSLMFVLDLALCAAALYIALQLRFEGRIPADMAHLMLRFSPMLLLLYMVFYSLGGVYSVMWRHAGVREMAILCLLSGGACGLGLILNRVLTLGFSRATLIIQCMLCVAFVGGGRFLWRMYVTRVLQKKKMVETLPTHTGQPRATMIVGAGAAGAYIINQSINGHYPGNKMTVLVDDDPAKQNLRIHAVPVLGTTRDIPALVESHNIRDIIVAMPSAENERLRTVIALCNATKCHVRVLSDPLDQGGAADDRRLLVREVNTSDFLARPEVKLDMQSIRGYLTDKTVLVTGGGGSIGSELCRQILRFAPKLLIIFDIYENCAYELLYELRRRFGDDCPAQVQIGSVRDAARLEALFTRFRPDVVFHAAAHKHVPLMEESPCEAVKNNVLGTYNVLNAAKEHGASRLVLLSTDKAVNPTNVMGATKRVAEMILQSFARRTSLRCMAVRFGNVLGSHGSVIPLFESQIKAGGPVTVTHPDITRYFMTIPEAAQLVLQAGGIAQPGAICVLDMGEPVRIQELAEKLIRFYGYEPGADMPIVYTGLRPGEKLCEELLMPDEENGLARTAHNKIFIAPPVALDDEGFREKLRVLTAQATQNDAGVVDTLRQLVPTFHREGEHPVTAPDAGAASAPQAAVSI